MENNTFLRLGKTIGRSLWVLPLHVQVEQVATPKADFGEMRLQQPLLHPHCLLLSPVPVPVILPLTKDK